MGTSLLYGSFRSKGERILIAQSRYTIHPNTALSRRVLVTTSVWRRWGFRSWAQWLLGYPEAALADAGHSLKVARDSSPSRHVDVFTDLRRHDQYFLCRIRSSSRINLSSWPKKRALHYGKRGEQYIVVVYSHLMATRPRRHSNYHVGTMRVAIYGLNKFYLNPLFQSDLAWAHALFGRNDDALLCIDDAITTLERTNERWFEAEADMGRGRNRA